MQTARAVAGFATGIEPVFAPGDEPRVVGGLEAAADFVVTLFAVRGTDIFRTRHLREHHRLVVEGAAGNRRQQQNDRAGGERQVPTAPALRQQVLDEWQFLSCGFFVVGHFTHIRKAPFGCLHWYNSWSIRF